MDISPSNQISFGFKVLAWTEESQMLFEIDPLIAISVMVATATTDAAYVFFNAAVAARRRVRAANLSGLWYLLSAFAVINYTERPVYVIFAALGSWMGAFASITLLVRRTRFNRSPP